MKSSSRIDMLLQLTAILVMLLVFLLLYLGFFTSCKDCDCSYFGLSVGNCLEADRHFAIAGGLFFGFIGIIVIVVHLSGMLEEDETKSREIKR